jgi:K+-sensing histidine kinase KdpD
MEIKRRVEESRNHAEGALRQAQADLARVSRMGLPAQQADQIFDAFFTTKPHGTGMGLRISRSIVESHGGRLWAVDKSPHGASFVSLYPPKPKPMNDAARPLQQHSSLV